AFVASQLQGLARAPLVADGGLRHSAEGLAAGAASAVTGPDLQVIGQVEKLAGTGRQRARRRFLVPGVARRRLQQVGPAEVADEDEVAGGDADRANLIIRAAAAVGDGVAQVLGRV